MAPLTVTAPVLGAPHTGGAAVSYRADAVLPTLLLGGMPPAAAASDLHAAGVTAVVSLVEDAATLPAWLVDGAFAHLHVALADRAEENLLSALPLTNEFIDAHRRRGGKVLVHCKAGYSRSAAVVMAYLMWKYGHSMKDALRIVRRARPQVLPNSGFLKQLAWYEQMSCASTRILLTARRLSTIAAPAYTAEALLPNARGVIW